MISRRNLLIGASCVAAAGTAWQLKPQRKLSLLGKRKMEAIIPRAMEGWTSASSDGFVKPKLQGLAATLYSEIVERSFISPDDGADVMLLVAYGGTQGDVVQLHRPEVCYPALGFAIQSKKVGSVSVSNLASVPAVRIVATAGERTENIVYWTRLGEDLPTNATEQRRILLKDAMAGFVPDGVLVRASIVNSDPDAAFKALDRFVPSLLAAVNPGDRPALIGTKRAKAII